MCEFSYFKPVSALGLKENKVIAIFFLSGPLMIDNKQAVWIGGMVPFWARTPCVSMQPSMDKSGESSITPPNQNHMLAYIPQQKLTANISNLKQQACCLTQ